MDEEKQSMKRTPAGKCGRVGRLMVVAGLLTSMVAWVSANLVTYVPWIAFRAIGIHFGALLLTFALTAVGYHLIAPRRPFWATIALALVGLAVITTLLSLCRVVH
ncbi:MAG: hypothetical protein KDB90_00320 [Planctomycetes bacterium]|nr:hypothetical protein [Planctomycetota bacterium]